LNTLFAQCITAAEATVNLIGRIWANTGITPVPGPNLYRSVNPQADAAGSFKKAILIALFSRSARPEGESLRFC